jgi:hypothetical protein
MVVNNDMNSATSAAEVSGEARVGDILPKAMGQQEMCRAFGISYTTFHRHELAGVYKPFLLPRPIGRKKYSGEKVQSFLNGRK